MSITKVAQNDAIVIPNVSATAAGNLFQVETDGFRTLVIQCTSAGTTNTMVVEGSNDGVTWHSINGQNLAGGIVTSFNAANHYVFPCFTHFIRCRISTYTSGTVTVNALLRTDVSENPGVTVNNGALVLGTSSTSAVGGTVARIKSAATTNLTLVKSSAGNMYSYSFTNTGATYVYIQFYNKASAPLTTDIPVFTLPIPPNMNVDFNQAVGMRFATGIGYAIVGGPGDTDATAVAADQVHGYILYA